MQKQEIVVVQTQRGRSHASFARINRHTQMVHIDGYPFVWALELILKRAPNLRTLQVIPSGLPRMHPQSHRRLCTERGVRIIAGHVMPQCAWEGEERRSLGYEAQLRFYRNLKGKRKRLFEELLELGFPEAHMAARYFQLGGEPYITQRELGVAYGYSQTHSWHVSVTIRAVAAYLNPRDAMGEEVRTRVRVMRARVRKIRAQLSVADARAKLAHKLGLGALPDGIPEGRLSLLQALMPHSSKLPRTVVMRFGLDNLEHPQYRTLLAVGRLLGVSHERVRQIEAKTLAKLGIQKPFPAPHGPDTAR